MTSAKKPARLADYELLAELATGGMATVYVARQSGMPHVERLVVVKRVHPHLLKLPKFREMFHDEARLASLIQHPNVVRLLDVFDRAGELLIVLEYVESASLSALERAAKARGTRLPPPVAARIVADALEGLHAAHEALDVRGSPLEIVHRDVSPQNIIVGIDGRSHIIDFGIAKAASRLTETTGGTVKGKLSYMSPEQAKGNDVDRRSDVFSAGIVLHEALTGRRLFESDDRGDGSHVLLKILLDPIDPPSTIASDVPPSVDPVVLNALERVRDERYSSAIEFRDALVLALPPATHREVAAEVKRLVGDTIEKRRNDLRKILDGAAAPDVELPETTDLPMLDEGAAAIQTAHAFAEGDRKTTSRRTGRIAAIVALVAFLLVGAAALKKNASSPVTAIPAAAASTPAPTISRDLGIDTAPASSSAAAVAAPSATAPISSVAHAHGRSTHGAHAIGSSPPVSATTPTPAVSASASELHNDNPY